MKGLRTRLQFLEDNCYLLQIAVTAVFRAEIDPQRWAHGGWFAGPAPDGWKGDIASADTHRRRCRVAMNLSGDDLDRACPELWFAHHAGQTPVASLRILQNFWRHCQARLSDNLPYVSDAIAQHPSIVVSRLTDLYKTKREQLEEERINPTDED